MKKITIISILCLFLVNCSSSDSNSNNLINTTIHGNWKLVQNLYFDFQNPNDEHFVTDGYEIEFYQNQTFASTFLENFQNGVYTSGIYSISQDSILTIKFRASSLPDQVYQKRIKVVSNTLLELSDDLTSDGSVCIEGCGERFNKIDLIEQ